MAKESPIKHIAVLGAGVMGAQLAGLFAAITLILLIEYLAK